MLSSFEMALACVGLAIFYNLAPLPRWLRPPYRPFNCLVCLSLWFGILSLGVVWPEPGWWATPLMTLPISAIVMGVSPWVARDS